MMNASLPPVLALALAPLMPAKSVVHEIFGDDANAVAFDLERNRRKNDGVLLQAEVDAAARFEAQYRMLTREA